MSNKEEVIEGLKKVWDAFDHMEHELYADYVFDALEMLMQYEPVRHGHWHGDGAEYSPEFGDVVGTWTCSKCNFLVDLYIRPKWNYCPICGARMDEVLDDG